VVTYPFHPLVGQTVLVTGDHEHDGVHHYLIRQPHGGSYQIPGWMFDPTGPSTGIVSVPRLPVSQLLQVCSLLDHLVACRPEHERLRGFGNEKTVSQSNGFIRDSAQSSQPDHNRTSESDRTPSGIAQGSSGNAHKQTGDGRTEGGGQ
jgi:hypothetical protein